MFLLCASLTVLCSSQGAVDALPGIVTQAVHAGSGRGGVRQADSAESFQLEQEGDMGRAVGVVQLDQGL